MFKTRFVSLREDKGDWGREKGDKYRGRTTRWLERAQLFVKCPIRLSKTCYHHKYFSSTIMEYHILIYFLIFKVIILSSGKYLASKQRVVKAESTNFCF